MLRHIQAILILFLLARLQPALVIIHPERIETAISITATEAERWFKQNRQVPSKADGGIAPVQQTYAGGGSGLLKTV